MIDRSTDRHTRVLGKVAFDELMVFWTVKGHVGRAPGLVVKVTGDSDRIFNRL